MDRETVHDGRGTVEITEMADIARLGDSSREREWRQRRCGFVRGFRDARPTQDGPRDLVDVFVCDVPEIRDEGGAAEDCDVSTRRSLPLRMDPPHQPPTM